MALKVTVNTGKPEGPRSSAGLIKRVAGEETAEKAASVTVAEIVSALFEEVRSSIEKEADVELELTANVEIVNKDGSPTVNLDISGESSNARTVRLKFNTKVNPPASEKDAK
jgi:nucleoid DNA-binding protein